MGKPKDIVFHAIHREYRSRQYDLQKAQEQRASYKALVDQAEDTITNAREAMERLAVFAHEQGWSTRDLDAR